jgi:serine/threonine-protein kinase
VNVSLSTGTRLGPYEIVSPLGSGGMGEVYRARDTRLGRSVAIKVLPEAVPSDPESLRRLEHEAQLLASLSHPHIAVLHGVEETQGSLALVMELVEGQTLAERIAQGPVPFEEAVTIARQVAEALEYAHEHGIVHRDLKPANIKLLPDGGVKVLDFGLAKALETAPAGRSSILSSPTITAVAATKKGVILGTAAYMSPEQAKGKPVDRRTDIWSFGCVLYEMLTGKLTFGGETVTDTLAAVVRGEPDWKTLPRETPASLRKLLQRCLHKDLRLRLQAIGEARVALEQWNVPESAAAPERVAPESRRFRSLVPWFVTALFGAGLLLLWHPWQGPAPPRVMHLVTEWGGEGQLYAPYGPAAVLSPEAARVAYLVEGSDTKRRLFVSALDGSQATALPGTEGARDPFFSPDGAWLAFFAEGKLKKVAIAGGAIMTLCDIQDDRGGAWGEDGTIVFAPFTRADLSRIPAGGGAPQRFSQRQGNELTHRWPEFLPGGKVVIYTSSDDGNNYENADIVAQTMATGERKVIYHGGYGAHYISGGFLVFMHEGTLLGAKFDAKHLALSGEPVPLLERVATNFGNAGAQFSVANTGLAAYITGTASTETYLRLQWLTSDGKIAPLRKEPATYWFIAFSPDGKKLALGVEAGGAQDVWVYDWQRDVATRLTFGGNNANPAWTPDGRRISYVSTEHGRQLLLWKRSDGGGDAQRLLESKERFGPMAWRPDGKVLVFTQSTSNGDLDLMWVSVEGDEKSGWKVSEPKPFLNSPAFEDSPAFSPDGKWLAYHSNESGSPQVYVRPFPGPGGRWQVSSGEWGGLPEWSRTGHQIFYVTIEHRIMVANYREEGDTLRVDTPQPWSNVVLADRGPINHIFSVAPDGKRIAVVREAREDEPKQSPKVTFLVNFGEEVRAKVAAATRAP